MKTAVGVWCRCIVSSNSARWLEFFGRHKSAQRILCRAWWVNKIARQLARLAQGPGLEQRSAINSCRINPARPPFGYLRSARAAASESIRVMTALMLPRKFTFSSRL